MPRGGKRKGAGRKLSYQSYVLQYRHKERQLNANGFSMLQTMYTKEQFELQYKRLQNEKISKGLKGNNITRELIDKQAYSLSFKQAKAYKAKPGESWYSIRQGGYVRQRYYEIKNKYLEENPDALDAGLYSSHEVSIELFGSPE